MKIKRRCKVCGNDFIAIKVTQFFCRRNCFKRDYYLRMKESIKDQNEHPHYPTKTCSFCMEPSQLNFDPMRSPEMFDAWGCPHCGATNRLIWEYQNNSNSYQIISEILISIQSQPIAIQQMHPTYETYYLPVTRPGQGTPSVIVMTCENLTLADVQKKNRKKLLFS